MKAEVEYTALVSIEVDLETGEVASVGIHPTREEPETPSEVTVSLESETDQPEAVFDRAQHAAFGVDLSFDEERNQDGCGRRTFLG